jgi:hypothetical protein
MWHTVVLTKFGLAVASAVQRNDAVRLPSVRHLLERWFEPLEKSLRYAAKTAAESVLSFRCSERKAKLAESADLLEGSSYGRYLDVLLVRGRRGSSPSHD